MHLEYFRLIDRILEFDPAGRTLRAEAIVPTQSTIFEGHFPGYPLMPGVLLLETMAQASGWLIIGLTGFNACRSLPLKEAKLRSFVTPGQSLIKRAELARRLRLRHDQG
jgi:3-hydroxyacyl-[acyl-carrier-protein] dehydratase